MAKMELKHKEEVKKLNRLEKHLIELIANTGDEVIQNKFLEWQKQRTICKLVYNEWIAEILSGKE